LSNQELKIGVKVYETASTKAHVVSTEKVRAKLTVIEDKQSQTQNWKSRQMAECANQRRQKKDL
jgi:hypothetical protein